MLVVPISDPGLGNTSYLIDSGDGSLVVDPERDPHAYLGAADGAPHLEFGAPASPNPRGIGVVVHCGHGRRAMTAASLSAGSGVVDLAVTDAGPADLTPALVTA